MRQGTGVIAKRDNANNDVARDTTTLLRFSSAGHHLLGLIAALLCLTILINGGVQQLQMLLLGGQMLIGNVLPKTLLCLVVLLGCLFRPRLHVEKLPMGSWMFCLGFLIFEAAYLASTSGMSLADVLTSFYDYYAVLLIAPVLLVFRGEVPERVLIRLTVSIFSVCALLAFAQHLTDRPILYTESTNGSFQVASWDFGGTVRAFSFFASALEFGGFCALCGALGIALSRKAPVQGILLLVSSGLACYCTLTRLCYLIFICTCVSTVVFTYGKKLSRGLWHPFLFFWLGIVTILFSLRTFVSGESNKLEDAGSLIERVTQWGFFTDLFVHSSFTKQMLGLGITQGNKIFEGAPMTIDNSPLALALHIGILGAVLFSILIFKMWLWLRKAALTTEQPLLIAVAGFWATLACAGIFNIVFSLYGTAFGLAILCSRVTPTYPSLTPNSPSPLAPSERLLEEPAS